MEDISLHILDIAENSVSAGACTIKITIREETPGDLFSLEIKDNGRGIAPELLEKVLDPFYTTRTTRKVGLGLSLLAQSARDTGGDMSIRSQAGKGTVISAYFHRNHIDMKPLGRIADTLITLIAGNPGVDFLFRHMKEDREYLLNTAELRKELEGIPLNSPDVLCAIRNDIADFYSNGEAVRHE